MSELEKVLEAIAKAMRHPDPRAWVSDVIGHLNAPAAAPAAPAAPEASEPAAPETPAAQQ